MSLHDDDMIDRVPIDVGLLVDAAGSERAQVRGRRNQVAFFVLLLLPFAVLASGVRNPLAAVAHEIEAEVPTTIDPSRDTIAVSQREGFGGADDMLHEEWEPGGAEADACQQPLSPRGITAESTPEPPISAAALPGVRVNMPPFGSSGSACKLSLLEDGSCPLPYQLFLPASWTRTGSEVYPVVVFLHGSGDGVFSVMNSQSLPRLLANDQSTSFDYRKCWCLESEYASAEAMRESASLNAFLPEVEQLHSPMADCTFASRFPAIVVMPQGWLPHHRTGWSNELLSRVEQLTQRVLREYRGDPERVVLTGQSAGGSGAAQFAATRPGLWSAVNIICAPWVGSQLDIASGAMDGLRVWIVGYTGDGEQGNDEIVGELKRRPNGVQLTRYTRYVKAPGPPDPQYRSMLNHASYDLIYRDPRLWTWMFQTRNPSGHAEWHV